MILVSCRATPIPTNIQTIQYRTQQHTNTLTRCRRKMCTRTWTTPWLLKMIIKRWKQKITMESCSSLLKIRSTLLITSIWNRRKKSKEDRSSIRKSCRLRIRNKDLIRVLRHKLRSRLTRISNNWSMLEAKTIKIKVPFLLELLLDCLVARSKEVQNSVQIGKTNIWIIKVGTRMLTRSSSDQWVFIRTILSLTRTNENQEKLAQDKEAVALELICIIFRRYRRKWERTVQQQILLIQINSF